MSLLLWLALCLGAGSLGGIFTADAVRQWYPTLHKPSWNPPARLFGPVWTTLYVMMAVAAHRIAQRERRGLPLMFFLVQLAFNAAWSPVFFGAHQIGAALAVLAALWLTLAATTVFFFRRDAVAGALLVPYLAWCSFAGVLNWAIWRLNP
ncbi:MAG: tryptophan-rich sensory protein [Kiritimatiellaeota bacterium]|nr:tryptophan-rich sensory protein [Kiritimatiellota bacterium]